MELVMGGKAQGKLKYILSLYNLSMENVTSGKLENTIVINNLENFIYSSLKDGKDPEKEIIEFASNNLKCIIICDEVGSGIVPIEPFEREYRDKVGHICCLLAEKSHKVHRVICGIGTVIKNA